MTMDIGKIGILRAASDYAELRESALTPLDSIRRKKRELESAIDDALRQERERCAASLELSSAELLLLGGEMTPQELRTVEAVLAARARHIRSLGN